MGSYPWFTVVVAAAAALHPTSFFGSGHTARLRWDIRAAKSLVKSKNVLQQGSVF